MDIMVTAPFAVTQNRTITLPSIFWFFDASGYFVFSAIYFRRASSPPGNIGISSTTTYGTSPKASFDSDELTGRGWRRRRRELPQYELQQLFSLLHMIKMQKEETQSAVKPG